MSRTARNGRIELGLEASQARLRGMEALLKSKDASLSSALGDKRSLEGYLNTQLDELKTKLNNSETHLKDEMLRRVDAENLILTLKEKLEFQKYLHFEELSESKHCYESRMAEMSSTSQQELETKLADALARLRAQHDEHLAIYKQEMEDILKSRVENVHQSAGRTSRLLEAAREELEQTQSRLEHVTTQRSQLQKQLAASQASIGELEEALAQNRDMTRFQLNDKDQELVEMGLRMQEQVEEYQELLEIKLALDREISTYRKLLEGEEERLHLSPCPSRRPVVPTPSSATASATAAPSHHMVQGNSTPNSSLPEYLRFTRHTSASGTLGHIVQHNSTPKSSVESMHSSTSSHSSGSRNALKRRLSYTEDRPGFDDDSNVDMEYDSTADGSSTMGDTSTMEERRTMGDYRNMHSMDGTGDMNDTLTHTHITQQATDSGHIAVEKVDPEGKYVCISNKSHQDQALGRWQVRRQMGSSSPIVYKFNHNFILKARQTVTIWAAEKGSLCHSPVVWKKQRSWGSGDELQITLFSAEGQEMSMRKITQSTPG
ncbi:prelamin-A/C-like [Engraulis encrasicolus]|uniref:prelamin-A/C-like n=1 Tax=Engraulis encrasicolus TaxID=184585 RepID=UPI002FCEBF3D